MKDKKVLIVIYQSKLGGAEKQAILYAGIINKLPGFSAEIIYCLEEYDLIFKEYCAARNVKATFIPLFSIGAKNFLPKLYYILKLRRLQPHSIISFTTMPNLFTGLTWKYTGAKYFYWCQLDVLDFPDYYRREWYEQAYNSASGIIMNARHIGGFLQENFPEQKPFHLVGNIIDIDTGIVDAEPLSVTYGIAPESVIITMLANIQVNKDHLTILKALLLIPESYKVHIMFVGYLGSNTEALISFINRNGLRHRVTLCGQVENVQSVLQHTDLLIHSSRSEGMSVAILEAVFLGIPVVATRIPGNLEIFGDTYPYYFEVGNETSLAQTLLPALSNYSSLKTTAKELKEALVPTYSETAISKQILDAINKE